MQQTRSETTAGGISLVVLLFAAANLVGAESDGVTPWRQDQPPNQPYSPQEAISRMTVPEGFTVELVASEPEIVNPIAMILSAAMMLDHVHEEQKANRIRQEIGRAHV